MAKKRSLKQWMQDAWDKVTDAAAKGIKWCVDNWQVTMTLISAFIGILRHLLKVRNRKQEEEYRNRRFYDRRTDRWCYAKRHLNRRQQNIIEERYLDGESYRSILDSMGLLK